jgi:hypothetical protein
MFAHIFKTYPFLGIYLLRCSEEPFCGPTVTQFSPLHAATAMSVPNLKMQSNKIVSSFFPTSSSGAFFLDFSTYIHSYLFYIPRLSHPRLSNPNTKSFVSTPRSALQIWLRQFRSQLDSVQCCCAFWCQVSLSNLFSDTLLKELRLPCSYNKTLSLFAVICVKLSCTCAQGFLRQSETAAAQNTSEIK